MTGALWILLGYLSGSIPFAYLAGRLLRGIDIRRYGTQNVGGSNVYENVSKPAMVIVGILDMAKAGLPAAIGLRLGLPLETSLAAGLTAVIGHNWPLTLRFHGGRGLSPSLGVLVAVFPLGFLWALAFIAVGWLFNNAAVTLAGFFTLPIFALLRGQPAVIAWATGAMFVLTSIKRLEANRAPLPPGPERWRVLARRLLLDRDIEDWQTWAHRRPEDLPQR